MLGLVKHCPKAQQVVACRVRSASSPAALAADVRAPQLKPPPRRIRLSSLALTCARKQERGMLILWAEARGGVLSRLPQATSRPSATSLISFKPTFLSTTRPRKATFLVCSLLLLAWCARACLVFATVSAANSFSLVATRPEMCGDAWHLGKHCCYSLLTCGHTSASMLTRRCMLQC